METQFKVHNMKEMREALESHLLNITDQEEEESEEKGNSKKIKTYIIESNLETPKNVTKFPNGSKLVNTDDQKLYQIYLSEKYGNCQMFLDSSDKRFWLLHTSGESKKIDDYIRDLITSNNSHLDYSWFSSNFLEEKCSIGKGEGFNIKYNNSFLVDDTDLPENVLKSFTMLFWGARPKEVISGLKENPTLASGVSLSRVKQVIKTDDGYVKENIGREGKFTLWKGDSIDSHLWAIDNVKSKYSDLISKFEEDYRIQYLPKEAGYQVKGTYCRINLEKRIENMGLFLKQFLSGNLPFRIFGIPQKVSDNYVKVNAVDLHNYDKLNIEIAPDFIRIYLYGKSCGNIIPRLMTNLQQYYDSQIKLVGYDNERLL